MVAHLVVANVLAGAYVPVAGRALGAGDDEPQLRLAGWAGAGGPHDCLPAQHQDGARTQSRTAREGRARAQPPACGETQVLLSRP